MAGKARPMPNALLNRLHILAFLTHERCRALAEFPIVKDPRAALSSRELECLRGVGAGKTDWEEAPMGRKSLEKHIALISSSIPARPGTRDTRFPRLTMKRAYCFSGMGAQRAAPRSIQRVFLTFILRLRILATPVQPERRRSTTAILGVRFSKTTLPPEAQPSSMTPA